MNPAERKRIYLDHASAMPVDPRVAEFAGWFLTKDFGNPSSLHSVGNAAKKALEDARRKVAELIHAESPECIIFTSGATEANNLAIKGCALRNQSKGKKIICSAIEHMSVINPMKELQKGGFEFSTIPVDSTGLVRLNALEQMIAKDTVLTSVMYANNEIGTVQPIMAVADAVHEKGGILHVDAIAAEGRLPIDVQKEGIDLFALSSNDIYGPPGAGALYVKPGVKIQGIMPGGGQEKGLRSGTENLFAIAGMGEAARIAKLEMEKESARLQRIRDSTISKILKIDGSRLTGHYKRRLPHHASFVFSGIEGESILLNMDMFYNVQISTGSACSSKTLEPSHVLLAIGLRHEEAHGSMVMTLGESSNEDDVPEIVLAVEETVARLRKMSPVR
ncbi:MAG: cysteine desulfurase family protein [Candidatus Thermoplasmatota archaeon]|nr:cysteine desulfurase family protein [Candidatus Thermoplasmatota archaeon]